MSELTVFGQVREMRGSRSDCAAAAETTFGCNAVTIERSTGISGQALAGLCATNDDLIDLHRRLTDADRHGLSILTTNTHALIEG